MNLIKYSILITVIPSLAYGVKVNMQGSLSFGKDVLDTLSHYMGRHNIGQSRRMMTYSEDSDYLYLTVKSTYLCRELAFCEGKFEQFLNEFITVLSHYVSNVIDSFIKQEVTPNKVNEPENHIFVSTLKSLLRDIKKILRTTNMRVSNRTAAFHWIELIKKITALFHEVALTFATDKLENNFNDNMEIKKKLEQKFIMATITIETKFLGKICTDYNICTNSYECTKALSTLLGAFSNMSEEKVKTFMRYVAEALLDSSFYSHVSEITANEFQVILNDMGFSEAVPTKGILSSLLKTVDARLNALKANTYFVGAKDAELVNVILSDMDHFYSKQKVEPFHVFLAGFFEWTRLDTKIQNGIREVINDIADKLFLGPEELQVKLIHEVRAFLELTVDPEK